MNICLKIIVVIIFFISVAGCGGTSEKGDSSPANAQTKPDSPSSADSANGNSSASNSGTTAVKTDPKQLNSTRPTVPAGDNSEITSVVNENGVIETRTFKSHPTLAKIERTFAGREVKVKVFLKNGQVAEMPADDITDFVNEPADQILRSLGKGKQNAETDATVEPKTAQTKEQTGAKDAAKKP